MDFFRTKRTAVNVLCFSAVALLVFLMSGVLLAQQETGQISGTITDQSGAIVPGAKISVRSTATSAERNTTSGNSGLYTITNLLPGLYGLTVEAQGFASAKRQVELSVGTKVSLDISLSVGTSSTTVEVVGESGVEINTESQTLSDVITTKQVLELPTLTRSPYDLVAIMGNVSPGDPTGRGVGFAINGQRAASTNVLLDGSDNNDTFTATVGQAVPLDSIQEFSVVTSSFTAEYGRASGGVVNVATKSGTNNFHGTVYEFNRLSKLASNDFNSNANNAPRGVFTRNQFGYSVGGPIIKDKLFFFSSTEWTRVRSSTTNIAVVPTPQLIAAASPATQAFFNAFGTLATPINGLVFTKDQVQGGLCNATGPCANLPGSTPVFGQVKYTLPADAGGGPPQDQYQTVARVDYNLSDKTTIYGRYALQNVVLFDGTVASSPYKGYNTGETDFNNNVLLSVTHTFSPRLVSQSKVVFNRLNQVQPLGSAPVGPTLYFLGSTPQQINGNNVAFPGYLPFSPGNAIPFGGPQNLGQIYQDVNYTRGNHQFRFGGTYVYIRDNRAFGAYETSVMTLGKNLKQGMDNFLNGQLLQFQGAIFPQGKFPGQTISLPVGPPDFTRSNRYHDFSWYVQDSWKVHPRVTLNLGLRWEYYGVQHNKDENKDSNFYFGPGSNIFQQVRNGQVFTVPNSPIGGLYNKDLNNYAPRVGVAWDVFGDGKTSLRGGYGISYERNFGNVTYNVIQNPPNYAVISIVSGVDVPNIPITTNNAGPLAGSSGTKKLPRVSLRHVNQDIRVAYAHFWSVTLEREVLKNTLFSMEYTGSKGVDLYSIENPNRPGSGEVYLNDPGFTRLNAQFGNINSRGNNGFSNYNAMVATLKSRNLFNQGLQLEANYTWSHAIDNLSSTFSESSNNFNLGLLDPFNPQIDKGNADFDIRHRIAISGIWNVPYAKNTSGVARQILDGWTFAPIFTASTGTPFSIFDCTNAFQVCPRMLVVNPPLPSGGPGNPPPVAGVPNFFSFLDLTGQSSGAGAYVNPVACLSPGSCVSDFGPFPANMTGRNAFRGPGSWNINLGVYKNFHFKNERYGLQFRSEFYNLVNHANLFVQGAAADISGTNFIPASRSGRRFIQFAMKFIF